MVRLALLPVFFLLLPGYTYAQDVTVLGFYDAGVLKDVGPFAVVVEPLPPDFERFGLHTDDIQLDVELKLRLAGITVDDDEDDYLYVILGALCLSSGPGSGICSYNVDIHYIESVSVPRGTKVVLW